MIIFELTCTGGHRFEGWFGSADDYEAQRHASMVRCPVCDDAQITKVPFAKVHKGREGREGRDAAREAAARQAQPATTAVPDNKPAPALAGLPTELVNHLRAMVRKAEDVGTRFPEEARKMHYDEVPARSIRGQATPDEAEALRDEGIEFASLPPFLTEDTH